MNRRAWIFLGILFAIIAGALVIRLSVTLGYGLPLGRDGPYHLYNVDYLIDHYPFLQVSDPPVFFHFAAIFSAALTPLGVSLLTSFNITTAVASAIVVPTTFFMMRKLTKHTVVSLAAAFFAAFVPASFRIFGELQKNAFGVSLVPLAVLFFWKGTESRKKLDLAVAGIILGVVGLTHELAFGTLVIAYISYLSFLLAHGRRIPWQEIKCIAVVAIFAAMVCGYFYTAKISTIGDLAGSQSSFSLQGENQQAPQDQLQKDNQVYQYYAEYIGQPMLVLAIIGAGVGLHRRRKSDFFLLAWLISAFVMAQPWVIQGYQWRFVLMLATPVALFAAIGLIDGAGYFFRGISERIGSTFNEFKKHAPTVGRVALLILVFAVVVQQSNASNTYAWTGEMLQPTISMEEYNSLVDFQHQFGGVYVFRAGVKIYWPDAVGLKADIAGGDTISNLSQKFEMQSQYSAAQIATEWYNVQQQLGENVYAVRSTMCQRGQILDNSEFFTPVFSGTALKAYSLKENYSPSENYISQTSFSSDDGQVLFQETQTGSDDPAALKVFFAPVYLLGGSARFIGVPLTVLVWVFISCLAWEFIRKTSWGSEKFRKIFVFCLVGLLAFASFAFVGVSDGMAGQPSQNQPPPGQRPPQGGQPPSGGPSFQMSGSIFNNLSNTSDLFGEKRFSSVGGA